MKFRWLVSIQRGAPPLFRPTLRLAIGLERAPRHPATRCLVMTADRKPAVLADPHGRLSTIVLHELGPAARAGYEDAGASPPAEESKPRQERAIAPISSTTMMPALVTRHSQIIFSVKISR